MDVIFAARRVARQLAALIAESDVQGMWTLQAGIFLENEAAVKLYEVAGFRLVGLREKIGQLQSVWPTQSCWNAAARVSATHNLPLPGRRTS
ncbi:GNAT family N-acetyltransferase [Hymenobacter lucidus]|uniref:GNAT family N-acetyltransferase n=1 Tax=Hymenobacter lucidus TaxID=2880930 RepID=A0ABS8AXZ8_9BACT|nr:hypothetical protein [Hymenobacter lucidus]MCB2410694.1 hypothetical protein [Hymenobacter lucidus]